MPTPAKTGNSRLFYIEGGARPDREPVFKSCWRLGGMAYPAGDVTPIECPSADEYGAYTEIGEIQGTGGRLTNTITGRFELDKESDLLRLRNKGCLLDIQAHLGRCTDPKNFNDCEKALMMENSRFTDWTTTDMGSLSSDAEAVVDESAPFSVRDMNETLPIMFAERGQDAVTNPIVDIIICDFPSCGDCENESDGCEDIYAVDDGATGSPGTQPDLVYSTNKGTTFSAENIGSLGLAEAATGVACVDIYIVVISNASNSLHYKEKSLIGDGVTVWVEEPTGFVVGGEPNDIWSPDGQMAFIVGDGGYVYKVEDPVAGVEVLDPGLATTSNLNAVHALNDKFAVAVGDTDAIIMTRNGSTWEDAPAVTGGGANLNCVWLIDENVWFIGDAAGALWYTIDGGETWTQKDLPGQANWTSIVDIAFSSRSVGRLIANRATGGRVLETWDGGYSWTALPRGVGSGSFPGNASLAALAVCEYDVNFVAAGGTATGSADGVIFIGED